MHAKVSGTCSSRIEGLYCITDRPRGGLTYESIVESFCAAGADIVQFRAKELSASEMVTVGRKLRKITNRYKIPLIVNDRLDVALIIGADGVHLGQGDLPVGEIKRLITYNLDVAISPMNERRVVSSEFIVGVSTHSLKEAIEAEKNGADYVSFGPIFSSPTKPELNPVGLKLLKEVKSKLKIPVVAIGGINEKNISQVIDAGPDAIAVISAICSSTNIKKSVKNLKARFNVI
ncbi:MAG: thiamine phosphate synthase [Elusimicrobiota bacterium]|nr:thiamine phosphate synthase [Elusimicrobiota bacterium]